MYETCIFSCKCEGLFIILVAVIIKHNFMSTFYENSYFCQNYCASFFLVLLQALLLSEVCKSLMMLAVKTVVAILFCEMEMCTGEKLN